MHVLAEGSNQDMHTDHSSEALTLLCASVSDAGQNPASGALPQTTAKRKGGRPKGPGKQTMPDPAETATKRGPGRPKGVKNQANPAGTKPLLVLRSKAKLGTAHPSLKGVWQVASGARKLPPGLQLLSSSLKLLKSGSCVECVCAT